MSNLKVYLGSYNLIQSLGWLYIMYLYASFSIKSPKVIPSEIYRDIQLPLKFVITLALLEIVNSATRVVRSSTTVTAVQVLTRMFNTWMIIATFEEAQNSIFFLMTLLAWTLTEIIRYSFYAVNTFGIELQILTWLRYTLFIILYPMGLVGELGCHYVSLPRILRDQTYTIQMPNRLNFSFNFYYFLIFIMILFLPGFIKLYGYMFFQRKKMLNSTKKLE